MAEDCPWGAQSLSMVLSCFPQAALHSLTWLLQQEWQYLQRVLLGVDNEFVLVEQAIADDFLLALFDLTKEEVTSFHCLLGLPTKFGGIGVPDPTNTGPDRHATSVEVTEVLVDALQPGGEEFNVEVYVAECWEAKKLHQNLRKADWSATLEEILAGYSFFDCCRLDRSTECGGWLTV